MTVDCGADVCGVEAFDYFIEQEQGCEECEWNGRTVFMYQDRAKVLIENIAGQMQQLIHCHAASSSESKNTYEASGSYKRAQDGTTTGTVALEHQYVRTDKSGGKMEIETRGEVKTNRDGTIETEASVKFSYSK